MDAIARRCGFLLCAASLLTLLPLAEAQRRRPTRINQYNDSSADILRAVRGICRNYDTVVPGTMETDLPPFRQMVDGFYQRNMNRVNTVVQTVSNLPSTGGQILSNLQNSVQGCFQQQPQLNAIYNFYQQNSDLDRIAKTYGDRAESGFDPQAIADGAVDCASAAADRFLGGNASNLGNQFLSCVTNSSGINSVRQQGTALTNSTNAITAQMESLITAQSFNVSSQGFQQCANQTVQQGTGQAGNWQGPIQGAGTNFAGCLLGGGSVLRDITGTVRGIFEGQGKTVTPGTLLTEIQQCMTDAATTVVNRADPRSRLTGLINSIEAEYTGMYNEVTGFVDSYQALYNQLSNGQQGFSLRGQIEESCRRYRNLGLPR